MALTTPAAFNEFKEHLKLTSAQKVSIIARRDVTAKDIASAFPSTSTMPVKRTKLIGSASRSTIIRPLEDVDLLAVFENKNKIFEDYRDDSQAFLYRVRDALSEYSRVQVVGARGQAVRFFYKEAPHVDVAPVFKWSGDGYPLPDGTGGWLTTDPDFHANYFAERARDLGSLLKPLVRMLKQWNRVHSRYLKSFHLEVMVCEAFNSLSNDSRDACQKFFAWAQSHIRVADPAGHNLDLSTYLTTTNRQSLIDNLATAEERAASANAAEIDGDHEEAIRQWRIVFGQEFPSYG